MGNMLRRREYNRRVRQVVEASWLASSAIEAPEEPALENGHAAEQQQPAVPDPAAGTAQQSKQEADAADAVAEPQAKRQRVEEDAAHPAEAQAT